MQMAETGEKRAKAATKDSKMNRIAAWIMVGIIAVSLVIGIEIWREYRDSIIDQQKQQMYLNVEGLGENLELFIEEYLADLDGLYQTAVGRGHGELDWQVLQEYVNTHSLFVYDVIVEDGQGAVIKSVTGHQIGQVYSSNQIDAANMLLLADLEDGQKYLILRKELDTGAISTVIDLERYYAKMIQGLRIGSSGYLVVKDADGIILMHPERGQWGIDVISGRLKMYQNLDLESLSGMIDHQKQGLAGVEEYYSYWWLKPGYPRVKKICAYVPVQIGTDFLVLSEVMDYDDIFIPVAQGVLRLLLLFIVIFILLGAMVLYMAHLMLQRRRDEEKITYLTELNQILEEMHRSEETIAHQQRLQIMGTMTGGIAHEFNNLLTPIMGYADLLMMDLPEDSEEYENALEIYEASAKAKEIIQQISSFSRKNMETIFKISNAAKCINRALKMVRSICPANIRLTEDIRLRSESILCNETQINQVILNICVNAFHAIGHQEGEVRIGAAAAAREELVKEKEAAGAERSYLSGWSIPETWKEYIHITVEDNGCGMSEEVLNQIFDPFFTTKKGGKGTGLGLALAEQVIRSHKGYLCAESRQGEGSRFHIYLPVNSQKEPGQEEELNWGEEKGAEDAKLLRLLIVDDNAKVLRLLDKAAASLPVFLKGCITFEEARQELKQQPDFDVLVVDQEIYGKSAVDFCMSVHGEYPEIKKIIMADRVTREIAEAKQRGVIDDYIDKPVSIQAILESYRSILNKL